VKKKVIKRMFLHQAKERDDRGVRCPELLKRLHQNATLLGKASSLKKQKPEQGEKITVPDVNIKRVCLRLEGEGGERNCVLNESERGSE